MSKNKTKSHKKMDVGVIVGKDIILNSAEKLGKHNSEVRTGTGTHKNHKKYDRKSKKSQQLRQSFKDSGRSTADFFLIA